MSRFGGATTFWAALAMLSTDAGAGCAVSNLNASDLSGADQFGYSVSVSGPIAVVGAAWQSCENGAACGAAYVFRLTSEGWQQEAKLENPYSEAYSYFGTAVGVAGNVIAVGSPLGSCENIPGPSCGSIYVYQYVGGRWVFQQELIAPNSEDSWVGETISISGSVILAGARFSKCANGIACGAAHVWVHDGAKWQYKQRLNPPSIDVEAFGQSVSTNGELLLVGAIGTDCSKGPDCGEAYLYKFNQDMWNVEQKLRPSDPSVSGIFGWSVSLEQDFAIISEPGQRDCGGLGLGGAAYVFIKQGGAWVQDAQLCATGAHGFSDFGWAVAAGADHALVTARYYRCSDNMNCGALFSFVAAGDTWILEQRIVNPVPNQAGGLLGHSVAVLGEKAFVGVTNFGCCGATYVFTLGPDCNQNGDADTCDIRDGEADDGNADGVPDECEGVASLDIEPGTCPNRVRSRERGVIKAALAGSEAFDVTLVDEGTLELKRTDGLGEAVRPKLRSKQESKAKREDRMNSKAAKPGPGAERVSQIELADREKRTRPRDVTTFHGRESCECGDDRRDGFDDLILKFDARELIAAFELEAETVGTPIGVMIRGAMHDGTIFEAEDCIVVKRRD